MGSKMGAADPNYPKIQGLSRLSRLSYGIAVQTGAVSRSRNRSRSRYFVMVIVIIIGLQYAESPPFSSERENPHGLSRVMPGNRVVPDKPSRTPSLQSFTDSPPTPGGSRCAATEVLPLWPSGSHRRRRGRRPSGTYPKSPSKRARMKTTKHAKNTKDGTHGSPHSKAPVPLSDPFASFVVHFHRLNGTQPAKRTAPGMASVARSSFPRPPHRLRTDEYRRRVAPRTAGTPSLQGLTGMSVHAGRVALRRDWGPAIVAISVAPHPQRKLRLRSTSGPSLQGFTDSPPTPGGLHPWPRIEFLAVEDGDDTERPLVPEWTKPAFQAILKLFA